MVGLREGTHTLTRGLCLSYWVKQEEKTCLGHSAIWLALKEKMAAYSSLLQPGLCYSFLKPLSHLSLEPRDNQTTQEDVEVPTSTFPVLAQPSLIQ